MERDHAKRLEAIGHKFSSLFQQNNNNGKATAADQFVLVKTDPNDSSFYEQTSEGSSKAVLKCAEVFFSKVYLASQASSQSLQDYSVSLLQIISDDIDQMLIELQSILKDARTVFRKNSDICRLSEAAIRNFLNSVNIAFESVTNASMKEIGMITMELNGLKGGLPYNAQYFASLSPISSNQSNNASLTSSVIDFSALTFDDMHSSAMTGSTSVAASSSSGGSQNIHNSNNAVLSSFKPGEPLTVAALAVATTAMANNAWTAASLLNNTTSNTANNSAASSQSSRLITQIVLHQPREDLWLSIQRYKIAVRESQEALCVLISESMDLELQQQILANRVHTLFTSLVKQYAKSELTLFSELHACWTKLMKDALSTIKNNGLPYPVLQSPFEKLHDSTAWMGPQASLDGTEATTVLSGQATDESFINSVGIFSFTKLFKDPLPLCPGIVRSGEIMFSHASDFQRSKQILFDGIWKTSYCVATSDGYLHMLESHKCDIPNRSFYLKQCIINEHMRDKKYREYVPIIFELSYSSILTQKKSTKQLSVEGVFFRTSDAESCQGWISDLLQLTTRPVHVDEDVEREAQASMLECLPILRGETEKIDLELKKYEELNQQAILSTMDESEQQQQKQQQAAAAAEQAAQESNPDQDMSTHAGSEQAADDAVMVEQEEEEEAQHVDDTSTNSATTTSSSRPTVKKQWKVESGAYILPQKAPTVPTVNGQSTTPKTNSNNGFVASSYKKDAESGWIKKDEATPPPMRSAAVGMVPVANITPKQIIPVVDARVPLARRHSQLIAQCKYNPIHLFLYLALYCSTFLDENGLKEEKAKASQKVIETRGKRLKDLILEEDDEGIDAIENGDREVDGSNVEGVPSSASVDASEHADMAAAVSGKKLVKKLSQKFDLTGGISRTQSSDRLSRSSSPMRIHTTDDATSHVGTPIQSSNVFQDIHEEGQQPSSSES